MTKPNRAAAVVGAVLAVYDRRLDPLVATVARRGNRLGRRIPTRAFAYAPPALYAALVAACAVVGHDYGDVRYWRSVGYFLLIFVVGVSARIIKARTDYHPAYAVEKYLETGAHVVLWAQAVFEFSGRGAGWYPFVWIGVFVASRVAAFEWIIRKNAQAADDAARRAYVKTQIGRRIVLPADQIAEMADYVSACARHGLIPRRYVEQLKADLGMPTPGRWHQRLRAQLSARRELAAVELPPEE